MEKERVLVCDNKRFFLKMFKRKFKDEFDFYEDSFLLNKVNESKGFDRSIFIVYDKIELLEFLKIDKKNSKDLLCLFNKQLYDDISFFGEINNLISFDDSKTRKEIIKELKIYLNKTPDFKPQLAE